ncbi:hypothetical protein [Actinomadura sediminis]|uniref:Uncharacterized protein n=1 Tax=Actinomadura sediminis TaxID=1038904 RepID=A0ABW3ESD1_9ACTN
MSPIPWPLIGRRDPYAGVTAPPVRLYQRPAPEVTLPVADDHEHAVMRRHHPWLRREEDVILTRLARLTDLHDPWEAAVRMFTDEPKESL